MNRYPYLCMGLLYIVLCSFVSYAADDNDEQIGNFLGLSRLSSQVLNSQGEEGSSQRSNNNLPNAQDYAFSTQRSSLNLRDVSLLSNEQEDEDIQITQSTKNYKEPISDDKLTPKRQILPMWLTVSAQYFQGCKTPAKAKNICINPDLEFSSASTQ